MMPVKIFRFRVLFFVAVCATSLLSAFAGNRHKMSALVRRAVIEAGGHGRRAVAAKSPGHICAFVRANPAAADSVFRANGCTVRDRRGDIFIADIPLAGINSLAAARAVSRIEASLPARPTTDTTAVITSADIASAGISLPQAFTGKGVVLGIMDVGFDLTHPTFYTSDLASYRVGAFWDQLDRDTVGSGFPVGRDYRGAEAVLAKQCSADAALHSHGTHTLGIAAGSGAGSRYRGIAFDSEICAVSNAVTSDIVLIDSADIYKYTSATDALGFKYLFDYADSRGMPCVASFSEGYHPGFDSEDSLYCEYLDRICGPGHIIVTSAGNESLYIKHLPKPAYRPSAGTFVACGDRRASFRATSDGPFGISIVAFGASRDTVSFGSSSCIEDSVTTFHGVFPSTGQTVDIEVLRYHSTVYAGDTVYYITVNSSVPIGSDVPTAVIVDGGRADVSLDAVAGAMFINGQADPALADAVAGHNILAPGCFPRLITVGAAMHRPGFGNYLGEWVFTNAEGLSPGERAAYSSMGPLPDGTVKPDVVAPGNNVISSYSSFYIEQNPDASDINSCVEFFDFRGRRYAWAADTGTSMAAPVVAGAVALWLQAVPTLTPEDVMEVIKATSHRRNGLADYPNNEYGYGEINVHAGLLHLLGLTSVYGLSTDSPRDVSVTYSDGRLRLAFNGLQSREVAVRVYSLSGRKVHESVVKAAGGTTVDIPLPSLPPGVYAVQADCRGGGSVLIRI